MTAFPKPQPREKAPRPLRRKTWMRKRRPRRLSRAGADPKYLAWLHTQPSVLPGDGPIEASHLRHHTGLGLKEPDRNAIPMARSVHQEWEQHRGRFAGWSNLERFAWFTKRIAETSAAYECELLREET